MWYLSFDTSPGWDNLVAVDTRPGLDNLVAVGTRARWDTLVAHYTWAGWDNFFVLETLLSMLGRKSDCGSKGQPREGNRSNFAAFFAKRETDSGHLDWAGFVGSHLRSALLDIFYILKLK